MSAMQICSYGWTVFVVVWLMAWFKTKRELIRTGHLRLGAASEEGFMRKTFGDEYQEYSRDTGALIPRMRL